MCEIIYNDIQNNVNIFKIKVLGPNNIITLPQSLVVPVCAPDPSSILEDISDIDAEILQEKLSHKDIEKIWNNMDTTYSENDKLFLYWYQKLRHATQKCIRMSAKRSVIPRILEDVKRILICAVCKLSDTSTRNWKGSSSMMDIRRNIDDEPGAGSSCDHLISHEPGLIP